MQLLKSLGKAAFLYSRYADKHLLFIFRQSKKDTYEYYEVCFGKRNFMHLAGIKSKTLNAITFFEACLNQTVTVEDCTPCHDLVNMHSKISIMESLLDLKNSKLYKIGKKDLVTKDNDFEMATGNAYGVIGYDSRVTEKGSKKFVKNSLPVPTTLLTNPITSYCRNPEKIMFILDKNIGEEKYKNVFYEIKAGLLSEEYEKFPEILKSMILCNERVTA